MSVGKEAAPRRGHFRKELNWFALLTMSLGTVIGSGWLLLPGVVASEAGPLGIFSWIFAGLAMLVIALVYAELGATWPAPGAVAKYPYLSHGKFTGHIAGWAALVSYAIIPPIEAVAVTRYAGSFIPSFVTADNHLTSFGLAVAIAILILIGLLNYWGVRYLAHFQNWVTIIKYVPILFFLASVGFLAFHTKNFTAFGGFAPMGASGFMIGTAGTLFAFLGFRQALDFGAEAKNPGRDMPRALIWTIVIATVTYALIALVVTGGIDWTGLAQYGVKLGDWSSLAGLPAPLYNITAAAGIGFVAWLVFADGVLSPNGPNATNVGSVPRVGYTMAEDGTMPRFFLTLSPRWGTPGPGLIACFLLEVFFLLITAGGYGALTDAVNVAFMVAYGIGPVAMGSLRKTAPHVKRQWTLGWAKLWTPIAFILASYLLYWSAWPLTGEVLAVLFVGVLIYFAYVIWGNVKARDVASGWWLVVYLIVMAGISYLGSSRFGGINVIPFGWDLVVVGVVALILYYWGVSSGIPYSAEREPESATVVHTGDAPTVATD